MRALVVYYSRTDTTRKAAQSLAEMLGADIAEIRCDRYTLGALGYMRAAFDSVRGARPAVQVPAAADAVYDLVVIAAPIWAGYPAAPMRSFLAGRKPHRGRVAVLLTHLGSPPDKAFALLDAELGRPADTTLALRQSDIQDGKASTELHEFVDRLKRASAV